MAWPKSLRIFFLSFFLFYDLIKIPASTPSLFPAVMRGVGRKTCWWITTLWRHHPRVEWVIKGFPTSYSAFERKKKKTYISFRFTSVFVSKQTCLSPPENDYTSCHQSKVWCRETNEVVTRSTVIKGEKNSW